MVSEFSVQNWFPFESDFELLHLYNGVTLIMLSCFSTIKSESVLKDVVT